MDVKQPLALLGGISPEQFMQRHWQKKPLRVRQAAPGVLQLPGRAALFELAAREAVESRLVAQLPVVRGGAPWSLRHGPFPRRALPPLRQKGWSLLVQGVDLHLDAAHAFLQQFRFLPDARLDDMMISFATDGGGVGPHFDSYDVFLLQLQGRRRWRIGTQRDLSLQEDVPLKILRNFTPRTEYLLEPGDMLYLPPRYAHDGVAIGECMTCSIGFRAPARAELAGELLQRLADDAREVLRDALYRDRGQPAQQQPAAIPPALHAFALEAVQALLQDPQALETVLGEHLSEPKQGVWFEAPGPGPVPRRLGGVRLDRRTRMLFDARHVFINGESYRASGLDATLMRQLANRRQLAPEAVRSASAQAQSLMQSWMEAGWMHEQ